MSHNILNIYSFADYEEIDTFSNLNAPSYTFLPDAFQQTLPPTCTNYPQNNQFLNSVALTQFANLPNNIHQQLFINTIPAWKPSRRLQKKLLQLFNDHYNQFPCIPCVYCGQLLYPEKATWVAQEDLSTYALFQLYPIEKTTNLSLLQIAIDKTVNSTSCRNSSSN